MVRRASARRHGAARSRLRRGRNTESSVRSNALLLDIHLARRRVSCGSGPIRQGTVIPHCEGKSIAAHSSESAVPVFTPRSRRRQSSPPDARRRHRRSIVAALDRADHEHVPGSGRVSVLPSSRPNASYPSRSGTSASMSVTLNTIWAGRAVAERSVGSCARHAGSPPARVMIRRRDCHSEITTRAVGSGRSRAGTLACAWERTRTRPAERSK
jgi:hypothetical protein